MKRLLCTMLLGTALWSAPSHADTTVCVDVKLHEVAPPPSKERSLVPPLTPAPAATVMPHSPALPFGPPTSGLKPPPPRPEPSAEEPADTEEQRQLRYMQQQIRDAQNQTPAPAATAAAPAIQVDTTGTLPLGQSPIHYLKRLLEHFVTHERGYQ